MTTLMSAAAFALWVIVAALFCTALLRGSCRRQTVPVMLTGRRTVVAGGFAVAAFFFIPPGSLPPFINHAWGGFFFLVCLAVSLFLSLGRRAIPGLAVLAVVCCMVSFYSRHRGLPGGFANLGTFAAMPLWSVASVYECTAFLLLALAAALAVRALFPGDGREASFPFGASFMACCALLVTLFLPWACAPYVDWPAWAVAGCDFALFWIKIICCMYAIHRFPFPRVFPARAAAFFVILGAALLFVTMD